MAEDLTDYLLERGIKVEYLHSDVDTLRRVELLRELREGKIDVIVGINLLREGLDLPEVSLVAILDADKEGFLRSYRSLIQTIGRAARNVSGTVVMYADDITEAMRKAIDETNRRPSRRSPMSTTCSPRRTSTPRHCSVPDTETRTKPAIRISACHIPARRNPAGGTRRFSRPDCPHRI